MIPRLRIEKHVFNSLQNAVIQCEAADAGTQIDIPDAIIAAGFSPDGTFHDHPLIAEELVNGGFLRCRKYAEHLQS